MANFSHLKPMELTKDVTARYTIHQITVNGKTPTLILKPAAQINTTYFNELLKSAAKNAKAISAGQLSTSMIDENREQDRVLFPKHVIVGWEDMLDADGTELAFDKNDCKDFIDALPDHIWDAVRNFATAPENFVETVNIQVTAKN
jgi:hypothetical protein